MNPGDSAELHNIPFLVAVKKVKRDDDTYTNEVGGYKAKGEAAAPAPPVQAAQTAATQGAAPWKR